MGSYSGGSVLLHYNIDIHISKVETLYS